MILVAAFVALTAMGILFYLMINAEKKETAELEQELEQTLRKLHETQSQLAKFQAEAIELWGQIQTLVSKESEKRSIYSGDHPIYPIAREIVRELDKEPQSGEWKFHQAFGKLMKAGIKVEKWQIGKAICDVVAEMKQV